MARILYDFLWDSVLFDIEALGSSFEELTDEMLSAELQLYRAHVEANREGILREARQEAKLIGYFGPTHRGRADDTILRQAALYFDRAVISDPLLPLTARSSSANEALVRMNRYPLTQRLDRRTITARLKRLRSLAPLVGSDFLTIAPLQGPRDAPDELPLSFSPTQFEERVPSALLQWFHSKAWVRSLEPAPDGGWIDRLDSKLEPSRGIVVGFHGIKDEMVFHLSEAQWEASRDSQERLAVEMWIPDEAPQVEPFQAWVYQSINQFAGSICQLALTDLIQAAAIRGLLVTDSSLLGNLFTLSDIGARDVDAELACLTLQLDVPFLKDLTPAQVVRVRKEVPEAFASYRRFVQRELREMRTGKPDQKMARLQDLEHELGGPAIEEVERKLKDARTELLGLGAVGLASVAAIAPTQGVSLAGALLALVQGTREYLRCQSALRNHPGFFLWKLKDSRRGASP